MPKLLLHIGYPKTATSWLQKSLFNDENDYFSKLANHTEVDKYITRPHSLVFDLTKSSRFFDNRLEQSNYQNKLAVISSEILCGNPFYGGREVVEYINRIGAIFSDAKILVTIRNQPKIYTSIYKQYIRRGGILSPQNFYMPELSPGYYGFDPLIFEYDKLFKSLADTFESSNVLFLCYEEFQKKPFDFIQKIFRFCEMDVNAQDVGLDFSKNIGRGAPDFVLPLLRKANRYRGGAMNPVNPGILKEMASYMYKKIEWAGDKSPYKPKSKLEQYCKEIATDRYLDSNSNLVSLIGEDLSSFGYPVKQSALR